MTTTSADDDPPVGAGSVEVTEVSGVSLFDELADGSSSALSWLSESAVDIVVSVDASSEVSATVVVVVSTGIEW